MKTNINYGLNIVHGLNTVAQDWVLCLLPSQDERSGRGAEASLAVTEMRENFI